MLPLCYKIETSVNGVISWLQTVLVVVVVLYSQSQRSMTMSVLQQNTVCMQSDQCTIFTTLPDLYFLLCDNVTYMKPIISIWTYIPNATLIPFPSLINMDQGVPYVGQHMGGGGALSGMWVYMQPVNFARCTSPESETERVDESWGGGGGGGGGGGDGDSNTLFFGSEKKILDHAPVGQYSESVYFRVPIHVVQCHIIAWTFNFFFFFDL